MSVPRIERAISVTTALEAAKDTLQEDDPLENALLFQLGLNRRMMEILPEERRIINALPEEVLGVHRLLPTRPVSTTSEVVFTESGLALKMFSFRDHETRSFKPNDHSLYAMTDARVRIMSAAGEVAIGQLMNKGEGEPLYYGLATVMLGPNNTVLLSQLDDSGLWLAVHGRQEVCIVMRKMAGSWLDLAQGVKNGTAEIDESKFADQVEGMLQQLLAAATPLEPKHAAELGSPERTYKTLVQDTPAWLAEYRKPEDYEYDAIRTAADQAKAAIASIQEFFALSETPDQLRQRAVPSRTWGGKTTAVQSYSSGDTKFGNILFDERGKAFFSDGLSLIVKTGQVPGNSEPVFAPWAFNDIMQSVAYFAIEPRYLGLDQVSQRITQGIQEYVGQTEAWTPWHDYYFEVLVAYKLLVEAACAVDNYLSQCDPATKRALPDMDAHTRRKIEEYPALAQQTVALAQTKYLEATTVTV